MANSTSRHRNPNGLDKALLLTLCHKKMFTCMPHNKTSYHQACMSKLVGYGLTFKWRIIKRGTQLEIRWHIDLVLKKSNSVIDPSGRLLLPVSTSKRYLLGRTLISLSHFYTQWRVVWMCNKRNFGGNWTKDQECLFCNHCKCSCA